MGNLLLILGILLIALIIMVQIAQWQSRNQSDESRQKINALGRWILPLLALGLVIQIVNFLINK